MLTDVEDNSPYEHLVGGIESLDGLVGNRGKLGVLGALVSKPRQKKKRRTVYSKAEDSDWSSQSRSLPACTGALLGVAETHHQKTAKATTDSIRWQIRKTIQSINYGCVVGFPETLGGLVRNRGNRVPVFQNSSVQFSPVQSRHELKLTEPESAGLYISVTSHALPPNYMGLPRTPKSHKTARRCNCWDWLLKRNGAGGIPLGRRWPVSPAPHTAGTLVLQRHHGGT